MIEIELLIKRENALSKQNLLYQLLGKFGDDLPRQIQDAIRLMAENESKEYNKLGTKVAERIK
jgi:HPt (histidine-containing phosphotransfer) domain-containing protein